MKDVKGEISQKEIMDDLAELEHLKMLKELGDITDLEKRRLKELRKKMSESIGY